MNERIQELAKQAQKIVGYTDGGYTEIKALDEGKFAELIIRDCFNEIKKGVPLVSLAEDRVFKHFGLTVNATKT